MSQSSNPIEACFAATIETPFGCLRLRADHQSLLGIELMSEMSDPSEPSHPVLVDARRQFQRYFANPSWPFSLPMHVRGSDFQCRVWKAMGEIPLGSAWTYAQLARRVGSSPRAVANACRANALPILIPCHRIVATRGIGGYGGEISGPMIEIKRWLLRHEGYGAA